MSVTAWSHQPSNICNVIVYFICFNVNLYCYASLSDSFILNHILLNAMVPGV